MISINIYEILMQMVNFLILLYFLNKFLVKPLSEFVEKRSLDIKTDIEVAENNKVASEQLLQDQKAVLNTARQEAKDIRRKAEEVSAQEHLQILENAKQESQTLIESAKKELQLTTEKAKKELLSEVGVLSVSLAEDILNRKLDHKDKESIVTEGMARLGVS